MKTTSTGRRAEAAVADMLSQNGHKIVALNWRTPRCEIDIVSRKGGVVYFTEVKYRLDSTQGTGFEYITSKKQQQMVFAASVWVQENDWTGDYRLQGAEVSGPNFESIQLVEL